MKRTDDFAAIEKFLNGRGLRYRFAERSKHNAIIVEHGGRDITVFFPRSGDRPYGPYIVLRKLRHRLGLVGGGRA
jgi:hypothetical protein